MNFTIVHNFLISEIYELLSLLGLLTELDVAVDDCEAEESEDEDMEDNNGNYRFVLHVVYS